MDSLGRDEVDNGVLPRDADSTTRMWKSQTLDVRWPNHLSFRASFLGEYCNDADVQAAQQAPHCQARIPHPHGRSLGPGRSVAPPQEGPQAAHGVDRHQARPRLTADERFPRSGRLVRGPDVRRVLLQGRRSRRTTFDIHWLAGEATQARLGLVVPRFRSTAPARNRLRRRLKELWRREFQHALPALDVVIRARRETYAAPFAALREDLRAWRELV